MGFSVNTNASALAALQTLNQTNRSLSAVQARINTGFRVGGAKDNASTFAIAQGMRGDIAGLKAVQESLSLGQATVNVALDAAEQISDKLSELKAKVTQGQASNVDRNAIQNDINSIIDTIDAISDAAQFNGVNLLQGGNDLDVVSSLNRTSSTAVTVAQITVAAQDLRTSALNVEAADVEIGTAQSVTFTQAAGLTFAVGDTIEITANNAAGNAINYIFEVSDGSAALTNFSTTTTADDAAAGDVVVEILSDPASDTPAQTFAIIFDKMREMGFTVVTDEDGSFTVISSNEMTAATSSGTVSGDLTAGTIGNDVGAAMTAVENAISSRPRTTS
jgi:flagellin